ncbi:hypothetical protein WR25_14226 isoform A [Diploscapter pachys]|uniref:Rad50/SbcC-type AAA domain-containing protein n=1 Tax=Diploscapter pachys TaxID=2018661 RepID=A0A2A2KT15_9BILA|nr:hypothetical protein WR25_14226 isoform A [Diploscapter pachys]
MAGQMDCDDSMMDAEAARDSSSSRSKRKSADVVDVKSGRPQPRTKKPRMDRNDGDDGQTGDETSTDTEANRRRDKTKAAARMSRIPREDLTKVAGRIAEIHLENFMCHGNTTVRFHYDSHNCHMMTGPNGSGKSSIFAAMNIGLGGKGNSNDRGSSVKDYVKTDQALVHTFTQVRSQTTSFRKAKIRICLTNRGQSAHPDYGEMVIVERTISGSTGASTYSLKSMEKKGYSFKETVVSKKKTDLDRLMARFGIQLNNPIFWLSQDRARSFLQDMKPSNLYQLYINATELERTAACYAECTRLVTSLNKLTDDQKAILDEKRKNYYEMVQRLKSAKKIDKMKDDLHQIMWKLVYCPPRDAKDSLDFHREKMKKRAEEDGLLKQRILVNREDRMRFHEDSEEINEKIREFHEDNKELNAMEQTKRAEIRQLENEVTEYRREINTKNQEKSIHLGAIKELESRIAKVASNSGDQMKIKFTELETESKNIQRDMAEMEKEQNEAAEEAKQARREHEQAGTLHGKLNSQFKDLDYSLKRGNEYLERLKAQKADALARFGVNIPRILSILNEHKKKFKTMPKGPLGRYVTLTEEQWALPVESTLAHLLGSFLFDNSQDAAEFRTLLRLRQIDCPNLYVIKFGGKRYSNLITPSDQWLTMYNVLDITDDDVFNIIVDHTRIEGIVLIDSDEKARNVMYESPPINANKAMSQSGGTAFPSSTGQYRFYAGKPVQDKGRMIQTKGNEQDKSEETKRKITQITSDCRKIQEELVEARKKLEERGTAEQKTKAKADKLAMDLQTLGHRLTRITAELQNLRSKISDLDDASMAVDGMKEDIEQHERSIREIEEQLNALNEKIKTVREKLHEHGGQLKKILNERKNLAEEVKPHEDSLNGLHEKIRELDEMFTDLEYRQKKLEKLKQDHEKEEIELEKKVDIEQQKADRAGKDPDITRFLPPNTKIPPDYDALPPTKEAKELYDQQKLKIEQAEKINKEMGEVTEEMIRDAKADYEKRCESFKALHRHIKVSAECICRLKIRE